MRIVSRRLGKNPNNQNSPKCGLFLFLVCLVAGQAYLTHLFSVWNQGSLGRRGTTTNRPGNDGAGRKYSRPLAVPPIQLANQFLGFLGIGGPQALSCSINESQVHRTLKLRRIFIPQWGRAWTGKSMRGFPRGRPRLIFF